MCDRMACSATRDLPRWWPSGLCCSDITVPSVVLPVELGDFAEWVAFVSPTRYSFRGGDTPLSLATDHERASTGGASQARKTRIVILGGGFGGVYTARHLEKLCQRRPDVEIVLVSRDNFLLITPLLFEVCSGTLDLRH